MDYMSSVRGLQFTTSEAAFIAGLAQREVQKAFDEDWFDRAHVRNIRGPGRRWVGMPELVHLRLLKDVARHAVLQTEAKKTIHRQLRERMPNLVLVSGEAVLIFEVKPSAVLRPRQDYQWDALASVLNDTIGSSPTEKQIKVEAWLTHAPEIERAVFVSFAITDRQQLRSYFMELTERLKQPVKVASISVDVAGVWEQLTERLADAVAAQLVVVSDPEIRGGEPVVRGTRIPVYLLEELVEQGATPEELLSDYPSLDAQRLERALLYARLHPRSGRPKKRPWRVPAAQ
jgi:uncharacterized protein (DUF433 family)